LYLLVGLRFVWRHPTIRPMTLMNTASSAPGGAVLDQFAPSASHLLGWAQEKTSLEFLAWGAAAPRSDGYGAVGRRISG
jgi:hypothetical protein